MRKLFQFWLCPYSRKTRLMLAEKKLDFTLVFEPVWEQRPDFIKIAMDGKTPVLIDLNGTVMAGNYAVTEYLEEAYPEISLMPESISQRAEVRRLQAFFDEKMASEVTIPLVIEKTIKRHLKNAQGPNSNLLRQAKQAVHHHLEYISFLVDRRRWLAGEEFSVADLCAAAHLSCVDYLGDVPWEKHELAQDWYSRIKSRPSFRALLSDKVPGVSASSHYANLDF